MKKAIYPIKFIPQPKERVWGGRRLAAQFHKPFDPDAVIGESWEVSGFEDDSSVIESGWLEDNPLFDVIETYMDEIVGEDNYKRFGNEFPILVKLLDIQERLSVQVHPDLTTRRPSTGTTPTARPRPGTSSRPIRRPGYTWDSTRIWMPASFWTAAPPGPLRRC